MIRHAAVLVCIAVLTGCGERPPTGTHAVTLMTFNVENLFDTMDDPEKDDRDYLPLAQKNNEAHREACAALRFESWRNRCLTTDWNDEVLDRKLSVVAETILQVDGRGTGGHQTRPYGRAPGTTGRRGSASSRRAGLAAPPCSPRGRPRLGSCGSRPRRTDWMTSSRWRARSQPRQRARGGGRCAAPRRSWRCEPAARRSASACRRAAAHRPSRRC